jgi:hypothetical protein
VIGSVLSLIIFGLFFGSQYLKYRRGRAALDQLGHQQDQMPPERVRTYPFAEDAYRTSCGFKVARFYADPPLATLTADEYWLQLRPRGLLRFMTRVGIAPKPIWIRATEVTKIVSVRVGLITGLRFCTPDGSFDGVVVWTRHPRRLLDGLAARGWPVASSNAGPN